MGKLLSKIEIAVTRKVMARSFKLDQIHEIPKDDLIEYNNIPPLYLVTSKADMLERYTLDFAGELGNKGIDHNLRHMGSYDNLIHAFPGLRPDFPESQRVVEKICQFFKEYSPK